VSYNVLIVDDSEITRSIIAKALRHANVPLGDVRFASNGEEALAVLEGHWIDIVFADLNMPVLSGVEMVERMAEHDLLSSVPVVIVSTEGRQDRIDALIAKGVAAYLRKPFTPEQVADIASELLGADLAAAAPDDLEEAFFEAIEGFAMLVAEPLLDAPPAPERATVASMSATGPRAEAQLILATSEAGAVAIAEAALGEAGSSAAQDAVRELLNVIGGHLVDSLAGGPFALDLPVSETTAGDDAWARALGAERWLAFDLEGAPVVLGATIRDRW
jgi:two-component system chemotaxis response regulator CheY